MVFEYTIKLPGFVVFSFSLSLDGRGFRDKVDSEVANGVAIKPSLPFRRWQLRGSAMSTTAKDRRTDTRHRIVTEEKLLENRVQPMWRKHRW